MADNWDDEDFEPEVGGGAAAVAKVTDKWDGEDEDDDDVKDDWDADSDEEKPKEESAQPVKVKKKKTLAQKIAEKEEAAELAKLEQMQAEAEAAAAQTPEAKLAEKLRLQKLDEDSSRRMTCELFGVQESSGGAIDSMVPDSKEDFDTFNKLLLDKFATLESNENYQDFAENFVKNLCMTLNVPTLKKVKSHAEAFHSTKLKEQKASASKAKTAKPTRGTLKMDTSKSILSGGIDDGYNDMDDFM